MSEKTPTQLKSETMPPPQAPRPYQTALFIILEIPDEDRNRKTMEEVLFRMDINYRWGVGKTPTSKPAPGHVFCWLHLQDPGDLFHVGIAYQSQLAQI